MKKDKRVSIIWKSLFITLLIFGFAILFNHLLDFLRIDIVSEVMAEHELDRDAFLTQQAFVESFSEQGCNILKDRFTSLKNEIKNVGGELGTYSKSSWFKRKDFDYLKRKYFLLEFELLAIVQKLNEVCGHPYVPILFFYEIDDDTSERQGFILDDLNNMYDDRIVVLSVDKDYKDEPLINTVMDVFNVTTAPTLIIGKEKFEGLIYTDDLNATIKKALNIADPYGKKQSLEFTIQANGVDNSFLIDSFEDELRSEKDHFARADLLLLIGRLKNDNEIICSALEELDKVTSKNPEEMALVYETIASIDCGRDKKVFYQLAAEEWEKIGKKWRAYVDYVLSEGDTPQLQFKLASVEPNLKEGIYSRVILGKSNFTVDNSTHIVIQTDRVTRDWLSGKIQNSFSGEIITLFSEKLSWPYQHLHETVGWHEGGRLKNFLKVGATYDIATGTVVAKKDNKWFAPDEHGIFRFEVPRDKVMYPTTRFLRKDLAVIIDTHGVNMLVDQALSHNADLVIGCGDHPGKMAAAKYLSDKGITVVSFPDKYSYLMLGHDSNFFGSPNLNLERERVVIGNRPMEITARDKIVASNSSNDFFALWYYQTPTNYFKELTKFIHLDITYYSFKSFGDQEDLVKFARMISANIIATRIYTKTDYDAVFDWLDEDKKHKAILFHSTPYAFGIKIFNEFPDQTSFGDVNPVLT